MSTPQERRAAQIQAIKDAQKREKIILRLVAKDKSYEEIGRSFDPPISRQRVQQIYKRATEQK